MSEFFKYFEEGGWSCVERMALGLEVEGQRKNGWLKRK